MLKIALIAVGEKMPQWVSQGYQQYAKRIRGRVQLDLIEISAIRRGKNADIHKIMQMEKQEEYIALVIGGAEGLSDESWSLSALTFAHPLVRVILAEQVFPYWRGCRITVSVILLLRPN